MSFLRSFAALSGASFVSMAANLVRGKLAAVFLGPAGVGVYNQLTLSYNVATLAGSLASNNGIIQHGSEAIGADDRSGLAELSSTMIIALSVTSLVVGGGALLASRWISNLLLGDSGAHWREVALLMAGVPLLVFATVYKALLGAHQAVRDLVKVQIWSEVGGVILFAALLLGFGLAGALAGFISVHAIALFGSLTAVRRRFGGGIASPSGSRFRWRVLRSNLGFGASGFIMVGLSNLALIGVNRIAIGAIGLGAAGLLANALRLSNVYLGAVTSTALNYYLPAVSRLNEPKEISIEVSRVVRFYCFLLPPIMSAIVALSPWLIPLIFSEAFLPALPLIAILVPAELFRIVGESLVVPLIARRRLVPHTLLFGIQTVVFVAIALILVPRIGLMGAAVAYAVAATLYCVVSLVTVQRLIHVRIDRRAGVGVVGAAAMLTANSAAALSLTRWETLFVATTAGTAWTLFMARDPGVRSMIDRVMIRFSNDSSACEKSL